MSIRANIVDHDILCNIQTKDVEFYLLKKKWNKVREIAGSIIFDSPDKELRIWVPIDGGFAEDYAVSMGKLLSSLSSHEDRSQIDIVEDFDVFPIGDVIRVGSEDPLDRMSSSLSLYTATRLIEKARQTLIVGASVAATDKDRAYFGSRKPDAAINFINDVRLGQTERGSYIIKVISPLPQELLCTQRTLPSIPEKPPFQRQAVEKTFIGLNSLRDVLTETYRRGRFCFEPFYERISDGVNADLCEAILGKGDERDDMPLNFSVSWSPAFAVNMPENIPIKINFEPKYYVYIEEAAKEFRKKEPEEISFSGYVVSLHKEHENGDGDITVGTYIDDKRRKIRMTLPSHDYRLAIMAHHKWQEVKLKGILVEGRLQTVTMFSFMDTTSDFWD
jgi:hypothetical protein